ncbi:MAG TPA: hypothetical protein V6D12_24945 [Candidatus Obscuribacterales bacterium]
MNVLWTRFFRSAYRKEPISSFVVIVGSVDAVIGGLDQRWSLLSLGVGTVAVAIALRWWQFQRRQTELSEQPAKYFLPATSSRPALPMLNTTKRHPPN